MSEPPNTPPLERATNGLESFPDSVVRVGDQFSRVGAFGLLLVEASGLSRVEGTYGVEASREVMWDLSVLVRETCGDRLGPEDLVVWGETGRYEILVFLFRAGGAARLYRDELPALREDLATTMCGPGRALLEAVHAQPPALRVGETVVLHDTRLGAGSQVRRAIEQARRDGELNERIAGRERRRELLGLLLAEDISSVYEPIVEVSTRTVFGYEALARGPERTPLHTPLALFKAASEESLIFELDCLCRRMGVAGALGLPDGTKLFLNIRPTAMYDPSFRGDALRETLERANLQPSDVVFEISEQESIEDFTRFRKVRDYFGKLGVQFALDDTGAGYASLQAVMELQPEFIKVDRTFVHGIDEDPARRELLRALHSVAARIDARIIAEGLDTLEELSTLEALGIPFGQGWLFGKPTPLRARGT